ncbi:hypothetical protein V1477_018250 [Vespula maculifrons]|uniref:Uncharacterized protein n=2 Tax=Vespula TaxID=7451 RepID=A0A834NLR6_VESVU|nr:hypothetical protein HZH66_001549 [Vespula vulgaris]
MNGKEEKGKRVGRIRSWLLTQQHKLGSRIDWNPAGSRERRRRTSGIIPCWPGPGNNVGNDEDGMPRYAGYRAELRSFEVGELWGI